MDVKLEIRIQFWVYGDEQPRFRSITSPKELERFMQSLIEKEEIATIEVCYCRMDAEIRGTG